MTIYNPHGSSSIPIVKQLPGLVGWYDANDPVGNGTQFSNNANVTEWYDKSGLGNNVTQALSTPPTYVLNIQNGLPVMSFAGTTNSYFTSNILTSNLTHTITLVSCATTLTNTGIAVYNGNSGSGGYGYYLEDNLRSILYGGKAQKNDGDDSGAWQIITMTWNATTSVFYLNGTSQSLTSGTTAPATPTGNFQIGANGTGGNTWIGYIGEVIVRNIALTLSQYQAELVYLSGKWGIAAS